MRPPPEGGEVEVLPLVAGQTSVREKEWLESLKTFGISAEDGKKTIYRLGGTLLSEHDYYFVHKKLFCSKYSVPQ